MISPTEIINLIAKLNLKKIQNYIICTNFRENVLAKAKKAVMLFLKPIGFPAPSGQI